jgi:hypothetical protein
VYSSLSEQHPDDPRAVSILASRWLADLANSFKSSSTLFDDPSSLDVLAKSIAEFWKACLRQGAKSEMYEEFATFLENLITNSDNEAAVSDYPTQGNRVMYFVADLPVQASVINSTLRRLYTTADKRGVASAALAQLKIAYMRRIQSSNADLLEAVEKATDAYPDDEAVWIERVSVVLELGEASHGPRPVFDASTDAVCWSSTLWEMYCDWIDGSFDGDEEYLIAAYEVRPCLLLFLLPNIVTERLATVSGEAGLIHFAPRSFSSCSASCCPRLAVTPLLDDVENYPRTFCCKGSIPRSRSFGRTSVSRFLGVVHRSGTSGKRIVTGHHRHSA